MNKIVFLIFIVMAVLIFPVSTQTDLPNDLNPQAFFSLHDYFRFEWIQYKHGDVMVASDFSHFIRLNGEVCYCHGRW